MQVIINEKTECGTVAELKQALPDIDLVIDENYEYINRDSCLCYIDLIATFEKAGIKNVYLDGDIYISLPAKEA
jgi:hypothetical protein